MVSTITPVDNKQGKYPKLKLKQSITLLESLRSCWSEDILVISCSDKFLRLSLQLLSRSDFTSPVNVSHFLWYFGFTMQTFTYVHMYRLRAHTRARAHTHTQKKVTCVLFTCNRYSTWLSSGLVARRGDTTQSISTPNFEWAVVAHIEDFIYV